MNLEKLQSQYIRKELVELRKANAENQTIFEKNVFHIINAGKGGIDNNGK